jgi:cytochrome c oxidase cbb3-type subunit 1
MAQPEDLPSPLSPGLASAVQHALFWLVIGNGLGVMIAILLLQPGLNAFLGEWTYGRWMMVHMNIALYGWCGLPMLGFLFTVYGVERGLLAAWGRPVVWLWSAALIVGSLSWLSGHSSGKLFLDWSGTARVFFPLAMAALWLLLAMTFLRQVTLASATRSATAAKIIGLAVLLAVPLVIFLVSSPSVYPAVNPDTGGPTGASQLESSLAVVVILLMVPFGIARRVGRTRLVWFSWMILVAEGILWLMLDQSDVSHHVPAQYLSLGSMLVWIPLIPAYYSCFRWNAAARRWRTALLWWWGLLVATGWITFLPGVLDRVKFTDVLVGHSLVAVAGFLSALLILVMIQVIGEEHAWIFNRTWSFHMWNYGVLAYVVVIMIAGWIEGADPAFTIVPGPARNTLYVIRLVTGLMMLAASVEWLVAALSLRPVAIDSEVEAMGVKIA